MARIIPAFKQYFDGNGNPLIGGYLKFLVSGTNNTDKNTYSDSEMTLPNTNPVLLDGEGRVSDIFGEGAYNVISYDSDMQQIQQFDPVLASFSATVESYDNIAELRAIAIAPSITSATIKGYYTDGDGGANPNGYYWDSTSTETHDGVSVFKATAIATGRWKAKFSGAIHVKWGGAAINNSAAANLTTFQAVIDSTADGTEIDIRVTGAGDYDLVSSSLTVGTRRVNWFLDMATTVGGDLIQSRADADLLPGTTEWGGRVWRSSEDENAVPVQVIKHNSPLNFFGSEAALIIQQKNDDTLVSGGAVDGSIQAFASDGDGAVVGVKGSDGAISALDKTLTSASAPFVAGDVGKSVNVFGAGSAGQTLNGTIASFTSATEVELVDVAGTTVTGAYFIISASTDSFWRGARTQMEKTGGGTGHCHTVNGTLGSTTTYNELGGYQGFLRNTGSQNGYISGVEMRVSDNEDSAGTNALETRMIGGVFGIEKWHTGSIHFTHALLADSSGNEDADTALKVTGKFRDGVNFKDAVNVTRWTLVAKSNGYMGWTRQSDNDDTLTNCNRFGQTTDAINFIFGGTGTTYNFNIKDSSANKLLEVTEKGFGYGSGVGGTVTQITDKSTAVTLNKTTGKITMHNAALAAGTSISFTLNNNLIKIGDVLVVNVTGADPNGFSYMVGVGYITTNVCVMHLRNISGGSLSNAVELSYAIIKGSTS